MKPHTIATKGGAPGLPPLYIKFPPFQVGKIFDICIRKFLYFFRLFLISVINTGYKKTGILGCFYRIISILENSSF